MGDDSDKKEIYKRYFFVDYENVNRDGMNGIVKLSDKDCVRVYYSDAAELLHLDCIGGYKYHRLNLNI